MVAALVGVRGATLLEEGPVEELPYLDEEPVEDSRPDWVIWVESAEERAAAIVMAGERRQASLLAVAGRLAVAAPAIAAGLAAVLAEGTTRYRLSVVAVAMCAGALWTVVTRIVPWLRIDVVAVYRALGVALLLALAYAVVVTRVSSPAWRAVCLGLLIWALTYRGLVALLAAAAGVSWRLVRRRLWSMPDEALVDALRRVEMPFRRRGALPRELIVHLIRRIEEVAREYEIASTRAWRTRVPIVDVEVRRWVRSVIGMIRALQIGMALNAISPEGVSTRLQTIMEAVATRDLAPGAELGRDKIWDNPRPYPSPRSPTAGRCAPRTWTGYASPPAGLVRAEVDDHGLIGSTRR